MWEYWQKLLSHSSCPLLVTPQPVVESGDPLPNPCRNVDCTDLLEILCSLWGLLNCTTSLHVQKTLNCQSSPKHLSHKQMCFCNVPSTLWGTMYDTDALFWNEHCVDDYSLLFNQLCFYVLLSAHCQEELLWWSVKTVLI